MDFINRKKVNNRPSNRNVYIIIGIILDVVGFWGLGRLLQSSPRSPRRSGVPVICVTFFLGTRKGTTYRKIQLNWSRYWEPDNIQKKTIRMVSIHVDLTAIISPFATSIWRSCNLRHIIFGHRERDNLQKDTIWLVKILGNGQHPEKHNSSG